MRWRVTPYGMKGKRGKSYLAKGNCYTGNCKSRCKRATKKKMRRTRNNTEADS